MDDPEDISSIRKKAPHNRYVWSVKSTFKTKYGSPQLCDTCNSMFSPKKGGTHHHADRQAVKKSALSGCYICNTIYPWGDNVYEYGRVTPFELRCFLLRFSYYSQGHSIVTNVFLGTPQNGKRNLYPKACLYGRFAKRRPLKRGIPQDPLSSATVLKRNERDS